MIVADLVALRSKAQRMADLWTGVVRLMEANKKTTFVIGINDAREVAVILEGIVSGREQASQAQVPAQGECGFEIWGECSSIAQKDSGANGIDSQQEDAPLTLPRYSRSDIETQTQAADEIARLREERRGLVEALQNLMGIFDNAVYRRRLAGDTLYAEAITIARAMIAAADDGEKS